MHKKNKNIGIVITDGVGYRNFVLSQFMDEVTKVFERVIIFSGIPKSSYDLSVLPKNITIIDLPLYRESKSVWFFRKLKEVAHMFLHRDFYGINDNLVRGYPKSNSLRALLTKLVYGISYCFHSEKIINLYEKFQFKAFKSDKLFKKYLKLIKEQPVDLMFFTHQRPPFLAPFFVAATQSKIKSYTFIFSWDNLASKGRMLASFGGYLVWSELMKKELLHFYPNTIEKNVAVVGTPQFEPYVMEKYNLEKNDFYRRFDLDLDKSIICYSCADADIGRNDEVHIRAIVSYLKKNIRLQLLVRTSPAEDGKRFEKLKNEFPEIKWNFPKWTLARENHVESWSQRLPSTEDVKDLKAILKYADVNVNMCSTMSLDFMLFDKPVINTVFGNDKNGLYDDQKFLNYAHYKYVIDSKSVRIAKNEKELHTHIDEALSQPALRKTYRQQLLDLEIGAPLENTSKRIVAALKEF